MASGSNHGGEHGWEASGESGLLEELRQPIAAASNYLGAARLLIAPMEDESCRHALKHLSEAEAQLLRAGSIIGKIRALRRG